MSNAENDVKYCGDCREKTSVVNVTNSDESDLWKNRKEYACIGADTKDEKYYRYYWDIFVYRRKRHCDECGDSFMTSEIRDDKLKRLLDSLIMSYEKNQELTKEVKKLKQCVEISDSLTELSEKLSNALKPNE